MKVKLITFALVSTLLLAGCSNNAESQTSTTTAEDTAEDLDVISSNSECALYISDFLKMGSLSAEEFTSQHPDWEHNSTDVEDTWENVVNDTTRYSYIRNTEKQISNYTVMVPVNSSPIDSWINKEVQELDKLMGTTHTREVLEGASWYYRWTTQVDVLKMQVYATGDPGVATLVFSITRSGSTVLEVDPDDTN